MHVFTALGLFIVTIILYVYLSFQKARNFFKNIAIPYIEPQCLFGNMKGAILHKTTTTFAYQMIYEKFQHYRFAGMFSMHSPGFLIRDPELVKNILVKDFSYFCLHAREVVKEAEPLAFNVFTMKGDEWKNTRTKLTATFTSVKIKTMFPLIKRCASDMVDALHKTTSDAEGFEAKDLGQRYSTGVIGSCAFGVDIRSFENPDSEFKKMVKRIFTSRWQSLIRAFFPNLPAKFINFFGLQFFDRAASDYFIDTIKDVIKHREENNTTRGDFIDLLMALKNEMTIEMIAAHCFIFLSGGFGSTASTFSFLLFELAQNVDIQNKIRSEISSYASDIDDLSYEMLKDMSYLNMVIAETLRKYPPTGFLHRICSQNYKIPQSDVLIKKGTSVIIPIRGLHYDKKYYENPDKFYPEHFNESAKSTRPPFTYLPFGEGPRGCIAKRFANMQLFVGVAYILKNFHVELSPRTKLPLELVSGFGSTASVVKGGVWLKCRPI